MTKTPSAVDGPLERLFALGGDMGALMREVDWTATSVGAPSTWPRSLRGALGLVLGSASQLCLLWGKDFIQFYNDAFRSILGADKHPAAMGQPARECWSEIWDVISPMYAHVAAGGTTSIRDGLLVLRRSGFLEECYFDYTYSPVRDEQSEVVGILAICSEVSGRVIAARRLRTLGAVTTRALASRQLAAEAIAAALAESKADIPFALLYLHDDAGALVLTSTAGIDSAVAGDWPLDDGEREVELDLARGFPGGAWPEPAKRAMVLPLRSGGAGRLHGYLVLGASPCLPFDDGYRDFFRLVAKTSAGVIEQADSLERETRRASELADLDRAKTAFFGNVSHEFRTPLTLMLAPIQDLASAPEGTAIDHEAVELLRRNASRLLELVNTLLEFSRIEAGRTEASYEPIDLAELTSQLADTFESTIQRAGLTLAVNVPPLDELAYVDRAMWEKIVLNLLSNAFKFTFEGSIAVSLRVVDQSIELAVEDTGTGISDDELPRLFERFHRIEGARSRSHEGSGIGLALIQQLVRLHGGDVSVTSQLGHGSRFEVRIPRGSAHLPADHVVAPRARPPVDAEAYLGTARRWGALDADTPRTGRDRILYADDNADMRDYVSRLLAERWDVETVGDGAAALASIQRDPPALLLCDVMMPALDGFSLTAALRRDPATRGLPIILLSARAGEDESAKGLDAGANDHIAKPFSSRDLLVRIGALLASTRVTNEMVALQDAQRSYLARLFEHAPVGIAVLRGPDHVFDVANPEYQKLVAGHAILHRSIRDALPELEGQGIYELLDRVYTTGEPFLGRSVRLMVADAEGVPIERFFDFSYQPVPDDRGAIESILVVAFEITELARARRDADAASLAKDEFFAMLGHELRNPLAPITTALELMRMRDGQHMSPEAAIIERQVAQISRLVDDLLDISRITGGKVALKLAPVEMSDVVAKAIEAAAPLLETRGHRLTVEIADGGIIVDGDVVRLTQVVTNVLTNAAKYTEPGGDIRVIGAAVDGQAVLRISDNGIGISKDMMRHVFEPFSQSAQALDRARGGLGLGLAIVANLVKLHHGTVGVDSAGHGAGSTFTISLPLSTRELVEHAAPVELRPAGADGKRALRVLVVDDNEDAAELLADALGRLDCDVRTAFDGVSALRACDERSPDVALLDIGLPVMDGYELARRIRERTTVTPYLVAVTGYGRDSDRELVARSGFDAHFVKPVPLDRFVKLVEQLRAGLPNRTT